MWKPNIKTLFFMMLLCAIMGGLTFSWIDWNNLNTTKGIIDEFQLPVIFLILSFYFMVPYVKKLKEDKKNKD